MNFIILYIHALTLIQKAIKQEWLIKKSPSQYYMYLLNNSTSKLYKKITICTILYFLKNYIFLFYKFRYFTWSEKQAKKLIHLLVIVFRIRKFEHHLFSNTLGAFFEVTIWLSLYSFFFLESVKNKHFPL